LDKFKGLGTQRDAISDGEGSLLSQSLLIERQGLAAWLEYPIPGGNKFEYEGYRGHRSVIGDGYGSTIKQDVGNSRALGIGGRSI